MIGPGYPREEGFTLLEMLVALSSHGGNRCVSE